MPTPAIATAALPTAMNFTTQKPELFSEATLPPPASEVTARTLEELEKKSAHLKELLTAGRTRPQVITLLTGEFQKGAPEDLILE